MRKIVLPLILLASGALFCRAQDVRRWGEDPVDWTGYRVAAVSDTATSFTAFTLLKNRETIQSGDVFYSYLDVSGAFLPYQSWVRPEAMNDTELQVIRQDFDLLEYFARAYRDDLLFATDKDSVKEEDYIARFRAARQEAHATGNYSKYALTTEEFDISRIAYDETPNYTGVSLALCTDFPFGDQARLLTPSAALSLTVTRGRGVNAFGATLQAGGSFFWRRYQHLPQKLVPYFNVTALYKREIKGSERMLLSFVGGPGFAGRVINYADRWILVGGPAFSEGLTAEFRAGRTVSLSKFRPEQADRFWQVRLSLSQLYNLHANKFIPSVNLSVGVHYRNRSITRK